MYTWAAHGMDKVGKVYVVGATDPRGPDVLGWERCRSVVEAVEKATAWNQARGVAHPHGTIWGCPPVGYARVTTVA